MTTEVKTFSIEDVIEVLQSGRYQQAQKQLYGNGGYCCLGVMAIEAGYSREEVLGHRYPDTLDDWEGRFSAAYPWLTKIRRTSLAVENDLGALDDFAGVIKELQRMAEVDAS